MEGCEYYKDVILENIRETNKKCRQLKRDQIVNKRRGLLGTVSPKFGVPIDLQEVIAIANKIKRKGLVSNDELDILTLAFIQNENYISHFVNNSGALTALVRDLTGTDSLTRLAATECNINLSLGNEHCCLKLAKSSTPYLITNLQGMCRHLQAASVWALGNLCGSSVKSWQLVNSQHVLPALLQLLAIPHHQLRPTLIYTLIHYVNKGFHQIRSEDWRRIAVAVGSLELEVEVEASGDLVWLLYLVSCWDGVEVDLSLRFADTCLRAMDKATGDMKTLTGCVRVLANVVAEQSGQCAQYVMSQGQGGHLDRLVATATAASHGHRHLMVELCWLVGNLTNHQSALSPTNLIRLQQTIDSLLQSHFTPICKYDK